MIPTQLIRPFPSAVSRSAIPVRAFSTSSPRPAQPAPSSSSTDLSFPTKPNPTPFEIFHLDPRAPVDPKALKARYFSLSKIYHPDFRRAREAAAPPVVLSRKGKEKEQDEEGHEFRKIVEAYEVLKDPRKRAVFLRSRAGGGAGSTSGWNDQAYNFSRGRPMPQGGMRYNRGAYPSASWDWSGDPYNPHFRPGASNQTNNSTPGWSSSGTLAKNSTVFLVLVTCSALLSPLTFWSTMPESAYSAAENGSAVSMGYDKRHWDAVRNLERARREAKDGGVAKREAIR